MIHKIFIIFTSVFLLCSGQYAYSNPAASSDTIFVTDFGLRPDSRENAVPYVQKALEACKEKPRPVLFFPEGRYDFWPHHCIERELFEGATDDINPKRLAILIEQMDRLVLDGNGSDFVFHDRMQPFTVDHSQNITIRNINVDWDIPLSAQATVARVTDEYIDMDINAYESPYIIENGNLVFVGEGWKSQWRGTMEFDKDTKMIPSQSGDRVMIGNYRAEELSKGKVRLHHQFKDKPQEGNLLVLRHSRRDHSCIFIDESKNILVEHANLYHYAGLGILAQYSENPTFRYVNCIPNEKKGRILAGHDDGIQVASCKGEVVIEHCVFHGLMDDPINVYGNYVRAVERVNDHTLRCKHMHRESLNLNWGRPGDKVGFINNQNLQTVATGVVKSFTRINKELFDLSFEEVIPETALIGYALENLTWTCNVSISDSYFKSCRARGVLVSMPGKVVIRNNIFESSGSAVLLSADANSWYLSGSVNDVLITKNVFKAPCLTSMYQYCEGVISIAPAIPQKSDSTLFHRNIVITDNEFHLFDYPILYALSVENIEFSDNRLIRSHDFEPWHPRKYGLTFDACKKITVKGNTKEGDILGNTIQLIQTSRKECKLDKNSLFKIQ
jgi:hypothetical protein